MAKDKVAAQTEVQ